ncbi:hypothetical protein Tsubulata_043128 [Turnera subulata]|uniref:Uncharacterized protein n=1 Tax=Turnera subulata TaxID=218843 RepID=A0A9Q0JPB1_9ROSI|nr:hypothetical protein Tsubulata_043128 [Turnera subulata]
MALQGADQVRRSGNYHPSVWGDFFVKREPVDKMLVSAWKDEVGVLKEKVRKMLTTPLAEENILEKLSVIDVLIRLGIRYHFQKEIDDALLQILKMDEYHGSEDISTIALRFRLLRQRGYYVPCDVFHKFVDANGNFKENLIKDWASYLSVPGEKILDDALEFTKKHLKSLANDLPPPVAEQVNRALQRPVQRNLEKYEQLQYISIYEKLDARNEVVLKLAKLDFNIVQSKYQEELRSLTEWWIELDLARKLPFFRDRLVECFLWGSGPYPDPELALSRRIAAKSSQVWTVIDDMYDAYGTIDELELFADAIERWDTSMKRLPDYMKLPFQALLDYLKEIEEETFKEGRPYCMQYIKEAVKRQIRGYITEARWFNQGYVPKFEEHRVITRVSTCLFMFTFETVSMMPEATKEVYDWLVTDPKILVAAGDHCRLLDDVTGHETEQKRGHVASTVECYMKEYGVSKEEAHEVIKKFKEDDWKYLNEEFMKEGAIPKKILKIFLGYARVMEALYGDFSNNYDVSDTTTKEMMEALLVNPIPCNKLATSVCKEDMALQVKAQGGAEVRRSGDFHPSVWGDFFLKREPEDKMLVSAWKDEVGVLKEKVRKMLTTPPAVEKTLEKLSLIDAVIRLGIGYHFQKEIDDALLQMLKMDEYRGSDDISTIALGFRLLRQRGYYVSSDVFNKFVDATGNFKENLMNDWLGLLNLYEASYLSVLGEKVLDDALEFTKKHLKSLVNDLPPLVGEHVNRRNAEKFEQLQYISIYERLYAHNEVVLKLAKLDFNIVQSMYREELRRLTKWWIGLDFATKLPQFFRDRLIEVFFWPIGALPEPELSLSRMTLGKVCALFTVIDDIYDVYGSIDELELFTEAIERWDGSIDHLPDYMKVVFHALMELSKQLEEETTKEGRPYCIQYVKEAVKRQIRAYTTEARWFNEGYVPKFEEYRAVSGVSTCIPMLAYQSVSMMPEATKENEQKRGHVASAVDCYMKEYGVSKEEAKDAIKKFIEDDWKYMNEGFMKEAGAIPKKILRVFLGCARVMDVLYGGFFSGYTYAETTTKEMMEALLVNPIPV